MGEPRFPHEPAPAAASDQIAAVLNDEAAETLELSRAALATTQEKALRAGLALLRAGLLAAQRDLESGPAVLEAGAEDLGDWQLMTSIKEQSAVREAVLSAELGERDQAARLVGGDDERPCSLPAAILLAQLKLAEHEATPAREVMAPGCHGSRAGKSRRSPGHRLESGIGDKT